MNDKVISFDSDAKGRLLDLLGKAVNDDGFIVEKKNPAQAVLSADGTPIKLKEFAGVRKGSEVYIKSDFNSLIDLSELM